MIVIRQVSTEDIQSIASLHALNWQLHYRGIFLNSYLDGPVIEERLQVWSQRIQHPSSNQFLLVAHEDDELVGFACTFLYHDGQFGHYMDNLHVSHGHRSKGIGKQLMSRTASFLSKVDQVTPFFLYVLEANKPAIRFYESTGGTKHERLIQDFPGGGRGPVLRFIWPSLQIILDHTSER